MATNNFIPELWSAALLENFHRDTVVTELANRDYEGELKSGSKITIPGIVEITAHDYKAAGRTTTPDEVQDTAQELAIDQEKAFDFFVDDVDRAQSKYSFDAYTDSAARALVEDAETFLTALLSTQGTPVAGAAPTDWKSSWDAVKAVNSALNVAKVPKANRYLVINSEFESTLLDSDSKLVSVNTSGDNAGLREATIGRVLGFNVVTSLWLPNDAPMAIGFNPSALAFVSQISSTESLRSDNKFADRVRGLHVYGAKVLRPEAVKVFGGAPAAGA